MITRHFIDIAKNGNQRRVHYRMAGNGPPLLMVHQSPRSSKEYEPLMARWAEHFTCIAPDTAGFGQSEPLPGQPDIGEYADATIDFLDALGIGKCAAYGFHSGGIILVNALKRHPNRITSLAIGGYAIWTAEEMELFGDKYLPSFHPTAFGEHLTWLWNRTLEQNWFFPWFAAEEQYRLSLANDDPVRVDAAVHEMLDAGNAYQAGYGAILRATRDIPAPGEQVPPCLISAYDGDPLQDHIERLGDLPPSWHTLKVATPAEHQDVSLTHLLGTETPLCEISHSSDNEGFLVVETDEFNGLIHWRGESGAEQLLLHAPGYAADNDPPKGCATIDLPGHGLSDQWTGKVPENWPAWQTVVDSAQNQLGAKNVEYPAIPVGDATLLYPDLTPDRFGAYLSKAWQIVRARHMFAPWYEVDPDNAISFETEVLAPERLANEHRSLLRARAAKQFHLALQSRQKGDHGN